MADGEAALEGHLEHLQVPGARPDGARAGDVLALVAHAHQHGGLVRRAQLHAHVVPAVRPADLGLDAGDAQRVVPRATAVAAAVATAIAATVATAVAAPVALAEAGQLEA